MSEEGETYYKQLALDYGNGAKLTGHSAAVHLEAKDDRVFWDKVFRHFLPQYSFDYITYTQTPKGTTATGCEVCLKYFKSGCLSKEFFICIDSDYRWLLQEKDINIEHFVFQTYTYSWENHYCYFENISKLGLSNIKTLLKKLEMCSKLLYRPFIYHLYSLKQDGLFSKKKFTSLLNEVLFNRDIKQIDQFKNFIENQIKNFKNQYKKEDIQFLETQCHKLGLNSKNAYLYFRGHNVFEFIIEITQKKEYNSSKRKTKKEWLTEDICFDKYNEINRIKRDTEIYTQLYI